MIKYVIREGDKFGFLTVIKEAGVANANKNGYRELLYLCRCDCGVEKVIRKYSLIYGKTISCGCQHRKIVSQMFKKHGLSGSRIENTWQDMIKRCEDKSRKCYKNYGGRGISVCEEWHDSEKFFKWAYENGYKDNLTIDRIDVNGNYEPSNCRWITKAEQARNKRTNRFFLLNGEKVTLSDISKITGIRSTVISRRLKNGMSLVEATGGMFDEDSIKEISDKKF